MTTSLFETERRAAKRLLRTLVVDDDAVGRLVYQRVLTSRGHEVQVACGASQALTFCEKEAFDLIVLNDQMPGMTGRDFYTMLQTQTTWASHKAVVLVTTANASLERLSSWVDAGAADRFYVSGQLTELIARIMLVEQQVARESNTQTWRYQATHDGLTDLCNRAFLIDRMNVMLKKVHDRQMTPFVTMFIDLDDFKQINDQYGHTVGDDVLVEVGQRLRHGLRGADLILRQIVGQTLVARLGGDEFVVILEEVSRQADAISVGARIQAMFDKPIVSKDHQLNIALSVGVAMLDQQVTDVEQIIRQADEALYEAKEAGKSQVAIYGSGVVDAESKEEAPANDVIKSLGESQEKRSRSTG